ncbi:MAG: glycosyltransferase family 2 protein [Chloroflexota bacterium]|nr:glycosyltransferase family 2 protein [Chloroflexota bacterium]
MPDLAIVIVNYKAKDLLRDCLRSVQASQGVSPDVYVVDNASADGSVEMTREEFPGVHLLSLPGNIGYGAANNVGFRAALGQVSGPPRYLLLLNPDTVLPPTALAQSTTFLDGHPGAGAVGPKLVRQDGSLDKACRRGFPTPAVALYHFLFLDRLFPRSPRFARYNVTYLDPDKQAEVDSMVGAFMINLREALNQAGLFDESFFMYGEDLDLCFRIRQHGWQIWYYPNVTVLHYKGASSKQNSSKANYEFYRAMLLFHQKHFASSTFFLVNWLVVAAIVAKGGWALLRNTLAPRVGSA